MAGFAQRVIRWQRRSGRSSLPWQGTRDPYRIWVSEIMLQQTQVATAIPYYERFMARFPDVQSLARASVDQVLKLWSGLGYYSRGRNLHRAARLITEGMSGRFPTQRAELETLPGVGRSTAAAIAAFSVGAREAILDGNVKRVLCRHFAVEGSPTISAVHARLWTLAESLLPAKAIEGYTQGLMDLGATVCTRTKPACQRCPLQQSCEALRLGRPTDFPTRKARRPSPQRRTVMLLLQHGDKVLLQKRPSIGIWGGLWSFPEFEDVGAALAACGRKDSQAAHGVLEPLRHSFSHYDLTIVPLVVKAPGLECMVGKVFRWWSLGRAMVAPIPAPVRTLLGRLPPSSSEDVRPGPAARAKRRAARSGLPARGAAA